MKTQFNTRLKQLRNSHHLTQDELSNKLNISRSAIGMYESGGREPDFCTLELLADFFNVDVDYLLGRSNKTTYIVSESNNYLTDSERLLIEDYRRLNPEGQEKVREYTQDLINTGRYIKSHKSKMVE